MINDDYERIKREIVFEKVAKAIKEDPKNWIKQVEDLGFEWFDDGYGDEEELEEKLAGPENPNQEFLVAYFKGDIEARVSHTEGEINILRITGHKTNKKVHTYSGIIIGMEESIKILTSTVTDFTKQSAINSNKINRIIWVSTGASSTVIIALGFIVFLLKDVFKLL